MSSGYRGGWSNTITTENLLTDPGKQYSLTEDLRDGVASAHRQQVGGEREFRNIRRTLPLEVTNVIPSKDKPGTISAEQDAKPGIAFSDRLISNKAPTRG